MGLLRYFVSKRAPLQNANVQKGEELNQKCTIYAQKLIKSSTPWLKPEYQL